MEYHRKTHLLKKAGGPLTQRIKLEDQEHIASDKGIVEVTHAPTGCMLIKRTTLEKMIKHYPELEIFQPTNINSIESEGLKLTDFFACYCCSKVEFLQSVLLVNIGGGGVASMGLTEAIG